MRPIAEIINDIQKLEGGTDLSTELSEAVNEIKTTAEKELKKTQKDAKTILALTSAEGETITEQLADAAKKIAKVTKEKEDGEKSLTKLTEEFSQYKKDALLKDAATKGKFNQKILDAILGEEDKVEIGEKEVTVNGKAIKEWAKETHPDYLPALFPSVDDNSADDLGDGGSGGDSSDDLGDGGSGGDNKDKTVQGYSQKKYNRDRVSKLIGIK